MTTEETQTELTAWYWWTVPSDVVRLEPWPEFEDGLDEPIWLPTADKAEAEALVVAGEAVILEGKDEK